MSYPNSALAAWQLAVIAVVAVGTLAVWLAAVYLAARPAARPVDAAAGTGSGAPGTSPGSPGSPGEVPAGQAADPGRRVAA